MTARPDSLRCFVAIAVPGETRSLLASFAGSSKRLFPGYRFVPPENLHITIQFLGDVPRRSLEGIREALYTATQGKNPFRVDFREAGAFPERGAPRILHVVATGGKAPLVSLARDVRESLFALGYGDTKPFVPHITLGRVKRGSPDYHRGPSPETPGQIPPDIRSLWKDSFGRFLEEKNGKPEWDVTEVVLMQSILRPEGALYTPLAAIGLYGT